MFSLYSVFDKAAEEFGPPFVAGTDAVAVRMFNRMMSDVVSKSDFTLHYLGEWLPKNGKIRIDDIREVAV